jgi:hypothetical protein
MSIKVMPAFVIAPVCPAVRAASICKSVIVDFLTLQCTSSGDRNSRFLSRCEKIKCLSRVLANYGGVLSKVAQMLSLDDEHCSVFSDCDPTASSKTVDYFKMHAPLPHNSIDFRVHRSGSIGHVHRAVYDGKCVAFKVQYVGLKEQTVSDFKVLDLIATFLYSHVSLSECMKDVKQTMHDELDYVHEAENQTMMCKLFAGDSNINIPTVYPCLSSSTVLCSDFMSGTSLSEFIAIATSEKKRNVGMKIFRFIFECMFRHKILYSDVHFGNFLVECNGTVSVIDFGCLHKLSDQLHADLVRLYNCLCKQDMGGFIKVVTDLGIITKPMSEEEMLYMLQYFSIQCEPLISSNFTFTADWLLRCCDKNVELMRKWTLPRSLAYLHKIPFGAYHVLTKLGLSGNMKEVIDDLIS